MKKILLLTFFFCFFVFVGSVSAKTNFLTYYNVSYNVSENEVTKVSLDIDLKNNTSEYYASSYSVQTGFLDIENISVRDSGGNVEYQTKKNDKGTLISFGFNKNVVGINNTQSFTINFETKEISKKYGSIWEVNIPGISNQSNFSQFNVSVITPQSFGKPSIIKPQVKNLNFSNRTLRFSKGDLGDSGISISYGDYQVYSFNLKYNLYNKEVFPVFTEIALPSNNNYQEVDIENINPKPLDVYVDRDGNWLAKYRLSGRKKITVDVTGKAKISYKPREETLSEADKQIYLKEDKYWEKNNLDVKNLATSLKTPEKIYHYVVENLVYDQGRVKDKQTRAGAASVLKNKNSAVCLEFTDLFIALARAAGIPAREVEGFANTSNTASRPLSLVKDVLHSWPEFYDSSKKAWIMVDPTWENTTGGIDYFGMFDFDHFAFVIKGEDSSYPIPAGGYKFSDDQIHDVEVTTSNFYTSESPQLLADTKFQREYLAGLPINGKITITNVSGLLSPNQTITVTSNSLNPNTQDLYFDKIPPFGQKVLSVNFSPKSILTNEEDLVKIKIGKEVIENKIVISPFYKNLMFYVFLGGFLIGSTLLIVLIAVRRGRRLRVS